MVDADSVRSALAVSRVRTHVDATLKPDVIITPTFVGAGDSMTVILTLRDLRGGPGGMRTASAKFALANADAALPGIVKGVVSQMESLVRAPALMRVGKPPQAPRGVNER